MCRTRTIKREYVEAILLLLLLLFWLRHDAHYERKSLKYLSSMRCVGVVLFYKHFSHIWRCFFFALNSKSHDPWDAFGNLSFFSLSTNSAMTAREMSILCNGREIVLSLRAHNCQLHKTTHRMWTKLVFFEGKNVIYGNKSSARDALHKHTVNVWVRVCVSVSGGNNANGKINVKNTCRTLHLNDEQCQSTWIDRRTEPDWSTMTKNVGKKISIRQPSASSYLCKFLFILFLVSTVVSRCWVLHSMRFVFRSRSIVLRTKWKIVSTVTATHNLNWLRVSFFTVVRRLVDGVVVVVGFLRVFVVVFRAVLRCGLIDGNNNISGTFFSLSLRFSSHHGIPIDSHKIRV